ncbi:hypothetical protein BC939DRAFT_456497 [Gamsiella multidivaricata]|uniref:uncharacterized protein n=1 Tax=Gamsiella multidivaricata TaxID=101098 RepID=UPI0022211E1B|nr:uncharacterized protein BC939DRAFT_456497 [Gamsiella multidivaricata]KAG0370101.1 hypothetical protein BGZ54_007729 [Gamsiella multidivaricata]KAI7821089.1 hypothetical protein BC939DRAFT_456497 [Gamsiella multidivaricata]
MPTSRQLAALPNPLKKPTFQRYDYQTFQVNSKTFEIRAVAGNAATRGRSFVMWSDIKDVIPNASCLHCGRRIVSFMIDDNGNRLQPLRIEYQENTVIQVIENRFSTLSFASSSSLSHSRAISSFNDDQRSVSIYSNSSYGDPYAFSQPEVMGQIPSVQRLGDHYEGYSSPTQLETTGQISAVQRKAEHRFSLMPVEYLSAEGKIQLRTALILYESFVWSTCDGETRQADISRNYFDEQFSKLEAEMSNHQELQRQMRELQQSMFGIQQEVMERLAVIQNKVHTILFNDYDTRTTPRLFIVLPKEGLEWKADDLSQEDFRLYFLCECGGHTQSSQGSNIPHHIHTAKHGGYDIESPLQFFQQYGSHILSLLQMLKYGTSANGFTVQALVPANIARQSNKNSMVNDTPLRMLEPSINSAIEYLMYLPSTSQQSAPTRRIALRSKCDRLGTLEGVDLGKLESYLKHKDPHKDPHKALGNLYRIVTSDGHFRWVCLDHYREVIGITAIQELKESVAIHQGTFRESLSRVVVELSTNTAASQFYKFMEHARFIQELKIRFKWDVSTNDLKALQNAIQKSTIIRLELACTSTSGASTDILRRNKRADPLWQMIANSKLQEFILSDFTGFFSRASISIKKCNLRTFKTTDRVEWKKESARVLAFIEACPHLKDLRIGCTELDAPYAAIKGINYDSCTLEHLTLESGISDALLAHFDGGLPAAMDLVISNMNSSLLQETRVLQALHLRASHLQLKAKMNPQLIRGIISRNPELTKLVLNCEVEAFLRTHITVKEALVDHDSHKLRTLKLYSKGNRLSIQDLHDENSVELELMSLNVPPDALDLVMRVYGNRLTKLRLDGDNLRRLFDLAFSGGAMKLKHVEITGSSLTVDMLYDLRLILRRSGTTLKHFTIMVDKLWQATEQKSELASFIADFGPLWTRVTLTMNVARSWLKEIEQRGFVVPEEIVDRIPANDGGMLHAFDVNEVKIY